MTIIHPRPTAAPIRPVPASPRPVRAAAAQPPQPQPPQLRPAQPAAEQPAQTALKLALANPARLFVHLTVQGEAQGAQLEFTARPGSLLGGPLSERRGKGDLRVLRADTLPAAHLDDLRGAYRNDAGVRLLLDQMAGQLRYGQNRMAVIADSDAVGQNVLAVVRGLASRLPAIDL